MLCRRGLAPRYIPPISLILATHAPIYVAGLTSYRYSGLADSAEAQTGKLRWLDIFVSDTLGACNDARDLMRKMEELQSGWRQKMGRVRANSSIDLLLKQLLESGVLKQTTIGRRNRAFEVPDLLAAITSFERVLGSPTGDTRISVPTRAVPARRE